MNPSVSLALQMARLRGFSSVIEEQRASNLAARDTFLTAIGYTVTPTGITVTPQIISSNPTPEKPTPVATLVEATKTTTQVKTEAASSKPVGKLFISSTVSSLPSQAQKIFGSDSTMLIIIAAVLIFVGVVLT